MTELEETLAMVRELARAVDGVEEHLAPLLASGPVREAGMPPLEEAQLQVSLAYALDFLFYAYLRAGGDPADKSSPVREDLERVKEYMGKIRAARDKLDRDGKKA